MVDNNEECNQYATEVMEKWESTVQYEEYKKKNRSKEEQDKISNELMSIFTELGTLKQLSVENEKVQDKIKKLQDFITNNYYACTNEILKGLGQMYVNDERFKNNIDNAAGVGTAEFVNKAILIYCSKHIYRIK